MSHYIIPQRFIDILYCANCKERLCPQPEKLTCSNCNHEYHIRNGIPDLTPVNSTRLPKIYSDDDYQKWLGVRAVSHDFFYGTKGVATVQNAGHRAVRTLQGNNTYEITLDLGCGDGAHYPYLKEPDKCLGVDMDQQSLEKLKIRFPNFSVVCADGYNLPVRDQSVDCIISIYNLEHMVYLDLILEEMVRILSPGGDIYISVPTEGGIAWDIGRSLGRNLLFTRKFALTHTDIQTIDYNRVLEIEHINCIYQLEKAFKRHFDIKKRIFFPFHIPSFQLNLITTYHCRARRTHPPYKSP